MAGAIAFVSFSSVILYLVTPTQRCMEPGCGSRGSSSLDIVSRSAVGKGDAASGPSTGTHLTCECPPSLAVWKCTSSEYKAIRSGQTCPYYKPLAEATSATSGETLLQCNCPPSLAVWKCTRNEYEGIRSGQTCPFYERSLTCNCPPSLAIWKCTKSEYNAIKSGRTCPYYKTQAEAVSATIGESLLQCDCPPSLAVWKCARSEYEAIKSGQTCPFYRSRTDALDTASAEVDPQVDPDTSRLRRARDVYEDCVSKASMNGTKGRLMCCPKHWNPRLGIGPVCRPCSDLVDKDSSALMCCPNVWKPSWGEGPACRTCDSSGAEFLSGEARCLPGLHVAYQECIESVKARQAAGENIATAICDATLA
eukprot:TRINITY_DN3319_c0_g1_i1.p1 TRINITY_DN3319_c0_g1~~TRINITY_DN3319_c0_g1_i1.p1  ORF type:complete len:416 (-),score=28.91 TRINITY_DN3319_c0_g1_i1:149-1243(-)